MRTVLIVEDEPAIADTIQYALETEGFSPVVAPTGQEALELIEADGVDLIILDIGLPDINGFELCKQIRQKSLLPTGPTQVPPAAMGRGSRAPDPAVCAAES